ncbi:hypothetical protein VUR80DRAFT_1741 [Thermomyces stellatus]
MEWSRSSRYWDSVRRETTWRGLPLRWAHCWAVLAGVSSGCQPLRRCLCGHTASLNTFMFTFDVYINTEPPQRAQPIERANHACQLMEEALSTVVNLAWGQSQRGTLPSRSPLVWGHPSANQIVFGQGSIPGRHVCRTHPVSSSRGTQLDP